MCLSEQKPRYECRSSEGKIHHQSLSFKLYLVDQRQTSLPSTLTQCAESFLLVKVVSGEEVFQVDFSVKSIVLSSCFVHLQLRNYLDKYAFVLGFINLFD